MRKASSLSDIEHSRAILILVIYCSECTIHCSLWAMENTIDFRFVRVVLLL